MDISSIHFTQLDSLLEAYFAAHQHIFRQLIGELFDERKQDVIYTSNHASLFRKEFNEVLYNNLSKQVELKAYIERTYYNGIIYELILFKGLERRCILLHNENYDSYSDNVTYIKITGYINTLINLANEIRYEANKHSIANLKHHSEVSVNDYDISRHYVAPSTNKLLTVAHKDNNTNVLGFFIVETARESLFNALSPYISTNQQEAFKQLIFNNVVPSEPLTHRCQQNSLAYLFWQLLEHKRAKGTHKDVTTWICESFTPATPNTIYDVIRGHSAPRKQSRIPINL